MASTEPLPVRVIVVPLGAPFEPAPRRTTDLVSVMVDDTVNVPAPNATTWCAGQAAMAALMRRGSVAHE